MSTWNVEMDISVTEFKQRCLELIRRVERTGRPVTITRRGRTVARLQPPLAVPVVQALDDLPPTFHGDPADRLIVATARAHALATHDRQIRTLRLATLWKPARRPSRRRTRP